MRSDQSIIYQLQLLRRAQAHYCYLKSRKVAEVYLEKQARVVHSLSDRVGSLS